MGGSGGVKRERGDECHGRGGGEGGGGEGGGETEPTIPEKYVKNILSEIF